MTSADAADMLNTLRTATGTSEPDVPKATAIALSSGTDRSTTQDTAESAPAPDPPSRFRSQNPLRPVQLQVLGPVCLHTAEGPITTGLRRSARDLVAYLALKSEGVTRDQAINALWPDHQPGTAIIQFNTAVANIRKTLRTTTGLREPMYVIHTAGRYRLDPDLIDVDLWQLTTTITNVRQAATDTDRIAALKPLTDSDPAEFATDLTHAWAENHREHLRRAITDALARLAQLLQHDHPEQALTALEQAIAYDPYAEALYRNLMQLQARLAQPDAAQRTYQLLTNRLTHLDTEPEDQTHQLLASILRRR